MDKIYVVFWTQSGNTQAMAQAVAEGITAAGKTPELVFVSEIPADALKDEAAFALGCPAMGAEVLEESEMAVSYTHLTLPTKLEESEMEPFVMAVETFAKGKKIALFGSYGWGDGQWMRDWTERMQSAGAEIVGGEGLICNETPDEEALEECRELGKQLAS